MISIFDLLILKKLFPLCLSVVEPVAVRKERIISIRDLGVTVVTRDFSWIIKHGKIQFKDL